MEKTPYKKKICKAKFLNISREDALLSYDRYFTEYKQEVESRFKIRIYKCSNCNFETKHRGSLHNHIKKKVCICQ